MSFYRIYRPQTFGDLYEQEHIRQTLENALRKNEVAQAYVFAGPRGTGKTSTARLLSKALLCETPDEKGGPCGKCGFCKGVEKGMEMDLIEVDAASHTGVGDVRLLIEKAQFAPTRAQKKVYIIDEVHMLSRSAFNALLKTLEEPPSHLHFILCTTEIEKIPDTILSRCQRFDFHRLSPQGIVKKLEKIADIEKITFDAKSLEVIAEQAEGGMRNAEVLLEQLASELERELVFEKVSANLGLADERDVEEFLLLLKEEKLGEAFEKIAVLEESGSNFKEFIKKILHNLRGKLLHSETPSEELLQTVDLIKIFRKAGIEIKNSVVPALPLEVASVKAMKLKTKSKKKEKNNDDDPSSGSKNNPEIKARETKAVVGKTLETVETKTEFSELCNDKDIPINLRNTLKACNIKNLNNEIIIEVGSAFFYSMLQKPINFTVLEKSVKRVFGESFIPKCVFIKKEQIDLPKTFSPKKPLFDIKPATPNRLSAVSAAAFLDE